MCSHWHFSPLRVPHAASSQKSTSSTSSLVQLHAGAATAGRGNASKSRAASHPDNEPQQRHRSHTQAQPSSPPLPGSSSIHPAIQAKLQQAHDKLLGQSRPGNRQDETAGADRASSGKPGPRSGQKGKGSAQHQPPAGEGLDQHNCTSYSMYSKG